MNLNEECLLMFLQSGSGKSPTETKEPAESTGQPVAEGVTRRASYASLPKNGPSQA